MNVPLPNAIVVIVFIAIVLIIATIDLRGGTRDD